MAIIFPSGLYTEGQGIFSALPYARMIEARKKAKDEAFSKYFNTLDTKINTEGVRDVDFKDPVTGNGILKDYENLRKYAIENKDSIAKGGQERLNLDSMFAQLRQRISQSKQAGKFETESGKAFYEKSYKPQGRDIDVQHRASLSIYNPQFYKESYLSEAEGKPYNEASGTPWGWDDLSGPLNSLTIPEKRNIYNSVKPKEMAIIDLSQKPTIVGGQRRYVTQYDPKELMIGADKIRQYVSLMPTDLNQRRLEKTYNEHLNDKDWMAKADPIFQSFYGRPINDIKDAAAADYLQQMSGLTGEKFISIKTGRTGGGAGGKEKGFVDYASILWKKAGENRMFDESRPTEGGFVQLNTLPAPLQDAVLNIANTGLPDITGVPKKYNRLNTFVGPDETGGLSIYSAINNPTHLRNKDTFISRLDDDTVNRIANKALGQSAVVASQEPLAKPGTEAQHKKLSKPSAAPQKTATKIDPNKPLWKQ